MTATTLATTPLTPPVFVLRDLEWDDLPRVSALDTDSPDPPSYPELVSVLESRYQLGGVCQVGSEVAGYMVYTVSDTTPKAVRRKNGIHLTVEILRVGVLPKLRRTGVGRFLVDRSERTLAQKFCETHPFGLTRFVSLVPERCLAAQLFFKRCGFLVPKPDDGGIVRRPFRFAKNQDGYRFERTTTWGAATPILPAAPPPVAVAAEAAAPPTAALSSNR